ncbi:T9SS type A sorting domain-containing protein [Hymenobacter sp. 5317J-9]|uniref:T9SS type A sorting domain-containing protein n=1 Tax=Hymenobacter sp. 5317J-9 TaxID=2932250 RepID=UPI001FD709E3|nr:T9SS type A sorting domain-containing protein [Hymenobacter sp. 5317J-9]UOQ97914.1 T9SS type A sorting domain-containing protein [Hymenobacter sp. 5317J-9]
MLTSFATSLALSGGRQLALPLPLLLLLAGPAARAQAPNALAEVGLYPNPAHIRATVEVPAVAGATRATVRLMDAQGTVVFEQPVSLLGTGGTTEVPLLGRAPGLYRVMVEVGEQRTARTLKVE